MILLRGLLGDVLRQRRQRQGRTLREVSADARVSLGYLSEVERGQKEASSELLAAICTALEAPLSEVLREASDSMALAESVATEPILASRPAGPLPAGAVAPVLERAPAVPVLERAPAAAHPRGIGARVGVTRVAA